MIPGFYGNPGIGIETRIRIVSLLVFLIPVYFFTIGGSYGTGFQTPVFRYQEIFLGSFIVLISNDLYNLINGVFQASQVLVVVLWCLGTFVLVLNAIIVFIGTKPYERVIKWSGVLLLLSGILYLSSLLVHYGLLFHNSSGMAVPLGLLLIFLLGIWVYRMQDHQGDVDRME